MMYFNIAARSQADKGVKRLESSRRSRICSLSSAVLLSRLSFSFEQGLSNGLYGPSLIDLAEIYASTPDEVAVMNSTRALGMFLGSLIGELFLLIFKKKGWSQEAKLE